MYVLSIQETARVSPPTPTYRDHGCDKYIPTARDDKVYDLNRGGTVVGRVLESAT